MKGILVASAVPHIRGSKPANCWQCGGGCYLAPSGRALAKRFELRVLCSDCGSAYLTEHPGMELMPLTQEQHDELVKENIPRN